MAWGRLWGVGFGWSFWVQVGTLRIVFRACWDWSGQLKESFDESLVVRRESLQATQKKLPAFYLCSSFTRMASSGIRHVDFRMPELASNQSTSQVSFQVEFELRCMASYLRETVRVSRWFEGFEEDMNKMHFILHWMLHFSLQTSRWMQFEFRV